MKRTLIFAGVLFIAILVAGSFPSTTTYEQPPRNTWPHSDTHPVPSVEPIKEVEPPAPLPEIKATSTERVLVAQVTAYNTVEAQTDGTPCISASGDNICGRTDVVACPNHLPLGTLVEIHGKTYVCLDRTHPKYNGRFDISFDKDVAGALQWGIRQVAVRIIEA